MTGKKNKDQQPIKAAALRYKEGEGKAPRVVARGSGDVARRIIELAREYGVPISEDPVLIEALSFVELNTEIPEKLYSAVAEVLAFVISIEADRQ
ncbi:MAG: EscU/YscU/HrcU family type III secretion system export apparatus switch protein [Thermodesulfobacteriota bacterium]